MLKSHTLLIKPEGHVTRAVRVRFAKTRNGPRYQFSGSAEILVWQATVSSLLCRSTDSFRSWGRARSTLSGVGPAEQMDTFLELAQPSRITQWSMQISGQCKGATTTTCIRSASEAPKPSISFSLQGWAAHLQCSCSSAFPCVQTTRGRLVVRRSGRVCQFFSYRPISDPNSNPDSPDLELISHSP